jgi:hypothetical protein
LVGCAAPLGITKLIHGLWLEILIALAIRLAFAPFTAHNDMLVWYIAAKNIENGFGLYSSKYFTYPPIWGYLSYFTTFPISNFFGGLSFVAIPNSEQLTSLGYGMSPTPSILTTETFNLLIKVPLISCDLVLGCVLYKYLSRSLDQKKAIWGLRLWLFNPLVISVSAIYGQMDVLPTLLVLIGTILFIDCNYLASAVFLGLATMLKFYPIYVVLLFLLLLLFNIARPSLTYRESVTLRLKKVLIFGCTFLATVIIILIPLFLNGSFHNFIYANTSRLQVYGGAGGATIFDLIYAPFVGGLITSFISSNIGTLSSILLYMPILILFIVVFFTWRARRQVNAREIILLVLISQCAFLFSLLEVNPQYIVWVLPFAIIAYLELGLPSTLDIWILSISMFVFSLIWSYPFAPLVLSGSQYVSSWAFGFSHVYTLFVRLFLFPYFASLTGAVSVIILYKFAFVSGKALIKT